LNHEQKFKSQNDNLKREIGKSRFLILSILNFKLQFLIFNFAF